jgi:cysteine-S-conjugate beta-lyase
VPVASLAPEIAERTITLMAPSKTFNIAGLAASFAVIPNAELRKQFERGHQGLVHGVNLLGVTAMKAAYAEGHDWLEQMLAYLQANRDALVDFVGRQMPGVRVFCPEGTYLAWLDFRAAGIAEKAGAHFLKQARVALVDGEAFGPGGAGFARLNFGCPRAMLLEALERMPAALPG